MKYYTKKEYKFIKLANYFRERNEMIIKLSFSDIEDILGFKLAPSAYKYKPYWNPSKTHTVTRAWIEQGYELDEVDLEYRYVTFRKMK